MELTADPGVLFLDEPTSGLDSFQAEAVVRVLGKLCREGRTVLLSIHQPSSQVFAMFDQLMLLISSSRPHALVAQGLMH